jgi:protein-S-isoprenylcysteine O-methyltransferase Ste14
VRASTATGPPPSVFKRLVKLAKTLVLAFILVQTLFLDVLPIAREPLALQVAGTILYLTGLAVAIAGRLQLGANWTDLEDYRVLPDQALVEAGLYRYIRHPIYAGDVLLLLGLELALNSWLIVAVAGVAAVVVRQALAEEALLAQTFPAYGGYLARTKRFIPFLI